MNISQVDFPSRLSVRAVIAGSLATLSMMILLFSLAGGVGLWSFGLSRVSTQDIGFWMCAFGAWILSLFISSYVTAFASRSATGRNGALHGFVLWASSSFLAWAVATMSTERYFLDLIENLTPQMLLAFFAGDLLALGAALSGGLMAAAYEANLNPKEAQSQRHADTKLEPSFTHL